MIVYRITGKKHANDLSGTGAAMFGGRWNKKGTPLLYTGQSIEIALLEVVVHVPPMLVPQLDLLTIEIPDDSIEAIVIEQLPDNWKDYPAPSVLAEIGENWVQSNRSIALKVPSCIVPSAFNYLLNCSHPDYHRIKLLDQKPFDFDERLMKTA